MTTSLFRRLGFLVVDEFVDQKWRSRMLESFGAAQGYPADVYHTGSGFAVREEARRTAKLEVPASSDDAMVERLLGIKTEVEEHFGVTLHGCQSRSYLRYGPGDFFQMHVDRNRSPDALDEIQRRLVSVVIFLNEQVQEAPVSAGTYSGGDLTFLTHLGPDHNVPLKVPFRGRAGMLVAFPADVPHEVKPVIEGTRYTVVSWFE